ncbi:unnamed protein product [Meloidogyne enterolobii]|uniref:Uncharacterized protein n=1 Tax=Meloidogyne enterolobii TaxID=390850 RepID=A0ACB0ZEW3_MELEN
MFLTFFNLLILIYLSLTKCSSSSHFSNIVIEKVKIIVDSVKVFIEDESLKNYSNNKPICVLVLHRGDCRGPKIKQNDKISWQEQICFLWRCIRTTDKLIMKIFDCWAGSETSPIKLIDNNGYTREQSLVNFLNYLVLLTPNIPLYNLLSPFFLVFFMEKKEDLISKKIFLNNF